MPSPLDEYHGGMGVSPTGGSVSTGDERTEVDFEELTVLSEGLLEQAQLLTADIETIVSEVALLRASWTGAAQEAFSLQFGYAQSDAEGLADWLTRASKSIGRVRTTYVGAEQTVESTT